MNEIDDYEKSKEETYNKVKIRQLINFDDDPTKDIKISVVIPIFNVEDFLGPCLDSVLNQTFEDFEVICVNDGSTDGSLEILDEYFSKDDRIKIIDKYNAGYGHTMNMGIDMASGKYFVIVESDDYILPTMFETLYKAAEENDLDFVKSDFYRFYGDNDTMVTDYQKLDPTEEYYNKVFSTSEDHNTYKLLMNTWTGLYNLDFLRKNNIRHSETPGASYQDNGFWFKTFYYGKRVMFVPEPFYMYRRDNPNSSVKNKTKVYAMDAEYDLINEFLEDRGERSEFLDAFTYAKYHNFHFTMDRIDLEFKKEFLMNSSKLFNQMKENGDLDPSLLDEYDQNILKRIVESPEEYYDYMYNIDSENYEYLRKYLQCRIDVKNYGPNGNDVDLIDFNDPLREFYKPMWFRDDLGIGSVLTSNTGSLNLSYECIKDGVIVFSFKGMDIRDRNGFKIPIYIDYTEIIIDDENLVTGSKVCWHDGDYTFEKKVKDGQVVNLQVKWRPVNPESILNLVSVPERLLGIFSSCRLDAKNLGSEDNDLILLDDIDSSVHVSKPGWFSNAEGVGTVITSDIGSLDLSFKCVNDGNLRLSFKAIDQRDKFGRRIPIFIDYTSISIDENDIISGSKVLWHDDPLIHYMPVKDGQIVNIKVKWKPLNMKSDFNLMNNCNKLNTQYSECRIDVKNFGSESNNIVLLNCDDSSSNISQPNWFRNSEGVGTVLTSNKGGLNLTFKCLKKGNLKLKIKPMNLKDKRGVDIPIFIDLKSVVIDGKPFIDSSRVVSSVEPFIYEAEVEDGQIINVYLNWSRINEYSDSKNILIEEKTLSSEAKALENQINRLINENMDLEEEIGSVMNSNSWKITKPLRLFRN